MMPLPPMRIWIYTLHKSHSFRAIIGCSFLPGDEDIPILLLEPTIIVPTRPNEVRGSYPHGIKAWHPPARSTEKVSGKGGMWRLRAGTSSPGGRIFPGSSEKLPGAVGGLLPDEEFALSQARARTVQDRSEETTDEPRAGHQMVRTL